MEHLIVDSRSKPDFSQCDPTVGLWKQQQHPTFTLSPRSVTLKRVDKASNAFAVIAKLTNSGEIYHAANASVLDREMENQSFILPEQRAFRVYYLGAQFRHNGECIHGDQCRLIACRIWNKDEKAWNVEFHSMQTECLSEDDVRFAILSGM